MPLVWSSVFLCNVRCGDTNAQLLGQRQSIAALHKNSLVRFVRHSLCFVSSRFSLIVFVVGPVYGGVAVDNVDLMLLRYLVRVIFPLPDDHHLSRCDVWWPYYCRRLSLVHQLQQHMTHYVIDVTPAHACVIDYVDLCGAVHLVRRVPFDLLTNSTLNSITRKERKGREQETHYTGSKSCMKKRKKLWN